MGAKIRVWSLITDVRDAPVLQHLRGRLHKVTGNARPVEARELRMTQQAVKDVAHFVEERNNIVVTHQGWSLRSGFG